MDVVKLGGSVLTNKREAGAGPVFRTAVARRLLREVKASGRRVVLVTGAGSFGHVLAEKYGLAGGFREDSQWNGFVEVARDVRRLNLMVLDEALKAGIRAISVPPSVCALQKAGELHYLDVGVFRRYLEQGLTPVTFGDVCLDLSEMRFSICSGDALTRYLSKELGAVRAIFVSDVDGIMVGEGRLAEEFGEEDIGRIAPAVPGRLSAANGRRSGKGGRAQERPFVQRPAGKGVADVTGGIREKARLALEMARAGTEVVILNGLKRGRLLEALKGGRPLGTWFRVR
ncbi:MAG: isopentenyl phosphate kinase [Thermoplasmata archaeon]